MRHEAGWGRDRVGREDGMAGAVAVGGVGSWSGVGAPSHQHHPTSSMPLLATPPTSEGMAVAVPRGAAAAGGRGAWPYHGAGTGANVTPGFCGADGGGGAAGGGAEVLERRMRETAVPPAGHRRLMQQQHLRRLRALQKQAEQGWEARGGAGGQERGGDEECLRHVLPRSHTFSGCSAMTAVQRGWMAWDVVKGRGGDVLLGARRTSMDSQTVTDGGTGRHVSGSTAGGSIGAQARTMASLRADAAAAPPDMRVGSMRVVEGERGMLLGAAAAAAAVGGGSDSASIGGSGVRGSLASPSSRWGMWPILMTNGRQGRPLGETQSLVRDSGAR